MRNIGLNYVFGQNTELNMLPLEFTVKTDNAGTSDSYSFTIPTHSIYQYRYVVDWGDGSMGRYTENASHTYNTAGEKTIKIYGQFPKFRFNNSGDRLKLLSIDNWGDIQYAADQNNAFHGCANLTTISGGASWFTTVTVVSDMFNGCANLTNLPSDMTLSAVVGGLRTFANCSALTELPEGMTLDNLSSNALSFFAGCSLTHLPANMKLNNVTAAQNMFSGTNLTTLPDGLEFANLTNGNATFSNVPLTSLPSSLSLPNLQNGVNMFNTAVFPNLPSGMLLDNLLVGQNMFISSPLTHLPAGMTLPNLQNGRSMFQSALFTDLPIGMKLSSLGGGGQTGLQSGSSMFSNSTIGTTRYSQLLIDLEADNPNEEVYLNIGNSKYNSSAVTARANLIARGWIIGDGGLE